MTIQLQEGVTCSESYNFINFNILMRHPMRHFYYPMGQLTLWLDNTHYSCKHTHTVYILSGHIFTHIHTTTLCAPVIPFTNYLCIPVSLAPVERLFCAAGILATCEGCCISHKLLEELISIKYNQFTLKHTFIMNYTLPTYNHCYTINNIIHNLNY